MVINNANQLIKKQCQQYKHQSKQHNLNSIHRIVLQKKPSPSLISLLAYQILQFTYAFLSIGRYVYSNHFISSTNNPHLFYPPLTLPPFLHSLTYFSGSSCLQIYINKQRFQINNTNPILYHFPSFTTLELLPTPPLSKLFSIPLLIILCGENMILIYQIIMSVKVGVRVRPFNQRETDLGCKLCVEMIGNMTRLFDADDPENGKHRDFTFDYSFWSHDEFEPDQKGFFVPTTDKYADQMYVFEQVGIQILKNAWEGYHCCLFAYGQTGAGKSYSMVGYGANKGIVPISCEQIFTRIANNTQANKQYEVMLSMMEIYNERVQDLLIPISKRPKEGHKIRQHKTLGIYVEGMSKHFVDTYQSIEKKMDEGSRNRSIAATEMNASSSRAHTIISIEFKQTTVQNGKKRQKLSVIYLVDLAGSEKVGKTGATGDRLKQAAGINKSLSVLGLVISALAEKSTGKGKNVIVPYRDSCLTRILQNALGGNSKTLMICAISPANDNYDETLSTLRYADQAKKIQNKAVVNQSETDKLIRTLTEERELLKEKVQKMQEMFKKMSMGITPAMLEQLNEAKQQQKEMNERINDRQTSKTDKIKHQKQQQNTYASKIDLTKPHLSNLNEDPQLSRKINYLLEDQSKIGKRNVTPANTIEIGGMGIRNLHAVILKEGEQYKLIPKFEGGESNCFINGDLVHTDYRLYHLDRVSFGTNNIFLILIPGTPTRDQIQEKSIHWDFAQNQLYLKKEIIEKQQLEEREQKIKEESEKILHKKEEELRELQGILEESEKLRKEALQQKEKDKIEIERKIREDQAKKLKEQIEKKKSNMREFQMKNTQNNKEKYYFERKLLKTLPKCIQLNLIAKQFRKNLSLTVKMMVSDCEDEQSQIIDIKKRNILIKIVNKDVGYCYWWDPDTLANRYYIIKDMAENYFQTGVIPVLQEQQDPFWDPPTAALIGRSFLTTKALTYMFDNLCELPIIGEDEQCGQLNVNLIPTDQTGTRNLCEELDNEEQVQFEPQQLLDKPFYFSVHINDAVIPAHYKSIFVQYNLKIDQFTKNTYKTIEVAEEITNPVFQYRQLHSFSLVTENILKYLTNSNLIFKIYGCEMLEIQKKKETTKAEPKSAQGTTTNKPQEATPLKSQTTKASFETTRTADTKESKTQVVKKKKHTEKKDEQTLKTAGSKVNNKINERDLKNPKEKDCQIY